MRKLGFTLIELLVVISIIGILAALGVVSYTKAQAQARDAKRLGDIRAIMTALQQYYIDNGQYPQTDWIGGNNDTWIPGLSSYMDGKVPYDANSSKTGYGPQNYSYRSFGNGYQIDYSLEADSNNAIGTKYAVTACRTCYHRYWVQRLSP